MKRWGRWGVRMGVTKMKRWGSVQALIDGGDERLGSVQVLKYKQNVSAGLLLRISLDRYVPSNNIKSDISRPDPIINDP